MFFGSGFQDEASHLKRSGIVGVNLRRRHCDVAENYLCLDAILSVMDCDALYIYVRSCQRK